MRGAEELGGKAGRKRMPWRVAAMIAGALAVALCTVTTAMADPTTGHWQYLGLAMNGSNSAGMGTSQGASAGGLYAYAFVSDSAPDQPLDLTGDNAAGWMLEERGSVYDGHYYYRPSKGAPSRSPIQGMGLTDAVETKPDWSPLAGDATEAMAIQYGGEDWENKAISEGGPDFWSDPLAAVQAGAISLIWKATQLICKTASDLCAALLGAIGASTDELFTEDFAKGSYSGFYDLAKTISDTVAKPFGVCFLAVAMGMAAVERSDRRRRMSGSAHANDFLMLLVAFVVCWWLIAHALDLVAAIYWLGRSLVKGVMLAISQAGLATTAGGMAAGISKAMSSDILLNLTYRDWGYCLVFIIEAFVILGGVFGIVTYVLGAAFIRMAEIYLRAAFSPIPLAFFVSEKTRPQAWQWARKMLAVCVQAGIIVAAMAFTGIGYEIASSITAPMFAASGGIVGVVTTVIPVAIVMGSLTGIVRKSESIANGIAGIGG